MSDIKLIGLTGATGVIGSRLLASLVKAYPEVMIRCFARNIPSDRCSNAVEWFQGDLMSEADCTEFVQGLDVIGHFAQSNTPAISDRHWPSDLVSNIGATLNLLEALRRREGHPCNFLFASSGGSVYGQSNPGGGIYSEDVICQPLSPYGIQKLAIEHYLYLASQQGWLTSTVLRISNVYGSILSPERRQGLIGVSISRILEGEKVQIFGSEETVRDYVHVDDVIRAAMLGIFQTDTFQIFNIGAGEGHSVREVLQILERVSGRPMIKESSDFGKNSFRLTPRVILSIEKARRELGWVPKISLENGITALWKSSLASYEK